MCYCVINCFAECPTSLHTRSQAIDANSLLEGQFASPLFVIFVHPSMLIRKPRISSPFHKFTSRNYWYELFLRKNVVGCMTLFHISYLHKKNNKVHLLTTFWGEIEVVIWFDGVERICCCGRVAQITERFVRKMLLWELTRNDK